jgi:hypothetical protein
MSSDELLNIPASRLLGLRVSFVHPKTEQVRAGRVCEISRTHLRISSRDGQPDWVRLSDVHRIKESEK